MSATELARIGGPVAAIGLGALLIGTRRELRLAGLASWALGGLALLPLLAPSGHRPLLFAGGLFGLGVAAGIAALLYRWPWLLPLGALAAVPARVHVHVGGTQANLLVPLYGLIAGAAIVLAWQLVRGDTRSRELGPLAWPLGLLIAWSGLSLAWSDDVRQGAITLAFFILPFGVLALALARLEWTRQVVVRLYALLAGLAVVFAAIGIYQWVTRDIFWNPKVIIGNAYHPELFFRVNSVFWDPSIYGRFLVVAILATLVIVLLGARREVLIAAIAGIAFVWVGLLFSFSQSSFAALFVGTLVAAAFVWRWRTAAVLGLTTLVVLAVAFAIPTSRDSVVNQSRKGLNHATSGRWGQVTQGLHIARDHPLDGVGLGAFKRTYADRTGLKGKEPKEAASHNTPVTVVAETGIPGLLVFGWLLAAALLAALGRAGPSFEGRVALIVGASLAAIAVHSVFYNAFFEDPVTWGLLALAVGASRVRVREGGTLTGTEDGAVAEARPAPTPVAAATSPLTVPPKAERQ
jgi:O-antigen ligase